MRILHYSLGLPPYRSGGLTKYCTDLIKEEKREGNDVSLLWPGRFLWHKGIKISRKHITDGIQNYEIFNPLPVPLDEGIVDIDSFVQACNIERCKEFLGNVKPSIFHIHTLMGLHYEWVLAAKQLGIKVIFTTHDYFGICPVVTLFRNGSLCKRTDFVNCPGCNENALSIRKITFLQSKFYRDFKESLIIKTIRNFHRRHYFSRKSENHLLDSSSQGAYKQLFSFYSSFFSKMDFVHFNSTQTQRIFLSYFPIQKSGVISISHGDIHDNKKIRNYHHSCFTISYLGPIKEFKGYFLIVSALRHLWANGQRNFRLQIFGDSSDKDFFIIHNKKYSYSELPLIFDHTDFLVVPSLWPETFGFTTLEALSYGVPVMVSENVGAKDLVKQDYGIIFPATIKGCLNGLNQMLNDVTLQKMNESIVQEFHVPTIEDNYHSLLKELKI
jgi:glycosyltransferase involved in cell wall biosynthesis